MKLRVAAADVVELPVNFVLVGFVNCFVYVTVSYFIKTEEIFPDRYKFVFSNNNCLTHAFVAAIL